MDFSFLLSNHMLNAGLIAWLLAQLLKTFIHFLKNKRFDHRRLAGAGGMPSSHSSVTCSVLLMSLYLYGFDSPVFALASILALIVMYDAMGVRWAAGLHAKAINHIVSHLDEADEEKDADGNIHDLIPKLNESLGHRVIEVVCGAALGLLVTVIYGFIFL